MSGYNRNINGAALAAGASESVVLQLGVLQQFLQLLCAVVTAAGVGDGGIGAVSAVDVASEALQFVAKHYSLLSLLLTLFSRNNSLNAEDGIRGNQLTSINDPFESERKSKCSSIAFSVTTLLCLLRSHSNSAGGIYSSNLAFINPIFPSSGAGSSSSSSIGGGVGGGGGGGSGGGLYSSLLPLPASTSIHLSMMELFFCFFDFFARLTTGDGSGRGNPNRSTRMGIMRKTAGRLQRAKKNVNNDPLLGNNNVAARKNVMFILSTRDDDGGTAFADEDDAGQLQLSELCEYMDIFRNVCDYLRLTTDASGPVFQPEVYGGVAGNLASSGTFGSVLSHQITTLVDAAVVVLQSLTLIDSQSADLMTSFEDVGKSVEAMRRVMKECGWITESATGEVLAEDSVRSLWEQFITSHQQLTSTIISTTLSSAEILVTTIWTHLSLWFGSGSTAAGNNNNVGNSSNIGVGGAQATDPYLIEQMRVNGFLDKKIRRLPQQGFAAGSSSAATAGTGTSFGVTLCDAIDEFCDKFGQRHRSDDLSQRFSTKFLRHLNNEGLSRLL